MLVPLIESFASILTRYCPWWRNLSTMIWWESSSFRGMAVVIPLGIFSSISNRTSRSLTRRLNTVLSIYERNALLLLWYHREAWHFSCRSINHLVHYSWSRKGHRWASRRMILLALTSAFEYMERNGPIEGQYEIAACGIGWCMAWIDSIDYWRAFLHLHSHFQLRSFDPTFHLEINRFNFNGTHSTRWNWPTTITPGGLLQTITSESW